MGQVLPVSTQILISLSMFVKNYWWAIFISIAIVVFLFNRMVKTREGKLFFDRLALKIPVSGDVILKGQMERFCRTFATLLGNGVTILPALNIVRDVLDNEVLRREITHVHADVREGSTLTHAMQHSGRFPIAVVSMVSVGEESGSLEKTLHKIADIYEREIDRSLKLFISLLEPFMILIMGAVVGFIVVAMLLPIFEINFMAR